MDLLSALLGAVLGALVGGLVTVRASARHWRRDRLLEAWTNVMEEFAALMTFLPPVDAMAAAGAEEVRDQLERELHARVTSLDRRVSILELLGDDEACALLKDAQNSVWEAVFLLMPRESQQVANVIVRARAIESALSRAFEEVESASTGLARHGRSRVSVWTSWVPGRSNVS